MLGNIYTHCACYRQDAGLDPDRMPAVQRCATPVCSCGCALSTHCMSAASGHRRLAKPHCTHCEQVSKGTQMGIALSCLTQNDMHVPGWGYACRNTACADVQLQHSTLKGCWQKIIAPWFKAECIMPRHYSVSIEPQCCRYASKQLSSCMCA